MLNRFKGFLYDTVLLLATIGPRRKSVPSVLIVKTDEIGDYMLWRKFLPELVRVEEFTGYSFHLCGNQSWKSLYDLLDANGIEQTAWLDKTRFKKELRYRYQFLRAIYKANYDTVINPSYSRDKRNDDAIVLASKAKRRIGMAANHESVRSYEKGYDKKLYTSLYEHPFKPVFEFYRNRAFTEFITGHPSEINNTAVDTSLLPSLPASISGNYFVIFPGSRSAARIWPIENFIKVARYLHEQKGWDVVICGSASDTKYASAFSNQYPHQYLNLTAKTTLPVLLTVLKNAKLLLSVDTGSVHLAAAVGCAVAGIFNGSQYGRFAPYPAEIAPDFSAVYPAEVKKDIADPEKVREKYEYVVDIPYSDVSAEQVIDALRDFIK